jgi:AraC family transcriptional regulator, regulatory protein of adaptative response / methylated-DNA-[protein]-cysteine methyltransferase
MAPTISYSFFPSPFGEFVLAMRAGKLCSLAFVDHRGRQACLDDIKKQWPGSVFTINRKATQKYAEAIGSGYPFNNGRSSDIAWSGTPFQIKVWKALLRIPFGKRVSYRDVAAMIGKPKAARAVANAVGNNPIALLIPCHRVIRSSGDLGGYHSGIARKKAIVDWEAS